MNSETKTIMIRLPKDLVDQIDIILTDSNLFLNKPDLIMWCIRKSYSEVIRIITGDSFIFYIPLNLEKDPKRWSHTYSTYKLNINRLRDNFNLTYKSKTQKSIAIHVPIGFFSAIEYMIDISKMYTSLQDFIKTSIYYGLSTLQQEIANYNYLIDNEESYRKIDYNEIINEFIKKSNENFIKNIAEIQELQKK